MRCTITGNPCGTDTTRRGHICPGNKGQCVAGALEALDNFGLYTYEQVTAALQSVSDLAPVDMVLYCPKCGTQHIDAPEHHADESPECAWTNRPHKTHLCAQCGHKWRPSDTPTNGVAATASGKDSDTAPRDVSKVLAAAVRAAELAQRHGGANGARVRVPDGFITALSKLIDVIEEENSNAKSN